MSLRVRKSSIAVMAFVALAWVPALSAQRGRGGPQPAMERPGRMEPGFPRSHPSGPQGLAIDRWNEMSPVEQQQALDKLPPERRKQFEQRVKQFNSLPPEEKDKLRERYQKFSRLSPEKQQEVREQIQHYAKLSRERHAALGEELANLRNMTDKERKKRLKSKEFRKKYSHDEQKMIRDLSEILPTPDK